LHAGISTVPVFTRWLRGSPLKPYRFLPMLRHLRRHRNATHEAK